MFEWRIALRYLVPRKKNLSTSLIFLLSVFVISLVVWLALIFLSVTAGIEKNWLQKLTSLNAPIQVLPTKNYFSSYYYQIDSISAASNFELKTIGEKAKAVVTDPYNPSVDQQPPNYWVTPHKGLDNVLIDPVKSLYHSLRQLKEKHPDLTFQDFELTSALTRIFLNESSQNLETSVLTQMTYLLSFSEKNPHMNSLMLSPTEDDINNLIQKTAFSNNTKIQEIFSNLTIHKIQTLPSFELPFYLLPEGVSFSVQPSTLQSLQAKKPIILTSKASEAATLTRIGNELIYFDGIKKEVFTPSSLQIFLDSPLIFDCQINLDSLKNANSLSALQFKVSSQLQKTSIQGSLSFHKMKIYQADMHTHFNISPVFSPPWPFLLQDKNQDSSWKLPKGKENACIVLPKQYKQHHIKIGDRGYFSYSSPSSTSSVEQRLYFTVAGFYDPGILPIGSRFIFVPEFVSKTLNPSYQMGRSDSSSNGVFVWFHDLSQTSKIRSEILSHLKNKQIGSFWKLQSFYEYEFSKDLMQQFQSDRLLFTLVAFIILVVACSSVISMLVLLVNDKRKEIAILQAMGAKSRNIAFIFGLCGMITGLLSSVIGILSAVFTLRYLDFILSFLSRIQGHEMFNVSFFGNSLPTQLSLQSVIFILIMTPVLSILAGLIPAIKASRLKPSEILRGE